MSNYGISILPSITNKEMDITAGSRSMRFLGIYGTAQTSDQQQGYRAYIDIKGRTAGSQVYIVPIKIGAPYQDSVSTIVGLDYVKSYWLEGDRLWLQYTGVNDLKRWKFAEIAVFEVTAASAYSGEYGIVLQDATNYLEISDANSAGCCVWAVQVTISGSWSAPADIPMRDNCVIFANWSNPNVALGYNNSSKTISCYGLNGASASVTARIAIFSSGFFPTPPEYGFAIWNAQGQCTFSSDYPPLLIAGTVSLASRQNVWVSTPVSRPLVPVSSAGVVKGASVGNGYSSTFYCGIRMNGNQICGGPTYKTGMNTESSYTFPDGISPIAYPILDADNYFTF